MSQDEAKEKPKPPGPFYDSWESATLSRVASRVEALGADADAMASRRLAESVDGTLPETEDFGWEQAVLRNLRRRLAKS